MHVSCKNRGIVELDLQSVFANDDERGALAVVKSLDLSQNELVRLGGLQPFSSLVGLDLSSNKLLHLQGLPLGLVRLNVSHNGLSSLEGLSALPYLQELDASHNKLTTLQGVQRNCPLSVLKVGHNRLPSARGVEQLPYLQLVEMNHNYIRSYDDVKPLAFCERLHTLTLAGNPVTDDPTCRRVVTNMLRALTTYDGTGVSKVLNADQRSLGASAHSTPELKPMAMPASAKGGRHPMLQKFAQAGTPGVPRSGASTPVGTPGGGQVPTGPRWPRSSTPVQDAPPSGVTTPRGMTPGGHDASGMNQSLPLSFDGVRQRVAQGQAERAQRKQQTDSEAGELRSLLEEEAVHSTTLQQQNKKLNDELSAAKGALGEEVEQVAQWKEELLHCQGELKAMQSQNEKLYKINRHLELKLKEEKERRLGELEKIKTTHNAVVESLKVRIQESADAVRATEDAEERWLEEKAKLQEYISILERENGQIAQKLSKHENASADAPHLYHGGGSQGVKLTWSPQRSIPARPASSTAPHPSAQSQQQTDSPSRAAGLAGPSSKPLAQRLPRPGQGSQQPAPAGHADTQRLIQMSRMANAGNGLDASPAPTPPAPAEPAHHAAYPQRRQQASPAPPGSSNPTPTRRADPTTVPPIDPPRGPTLTAGGHVAASAGSSTHGGLGQAVPARLSTTRESPRPSVRHDPDVMQSRTGAFSEVASSVASERTETTKNALEFAVQLKKWLLTEMDKKSPSKAQHVPQVGAPGHRAQPTGVAAMWSRGESGLDVNEIMSRQSP